MKTGLSLPYTYLSESTVKTDEIFISGLGIPDRALTELSSKIEYIELSNFSTLASTEHIVSAVRKIWKHGLKVSLHPSLPLDVHGKSLTGIYPWLNDLLPEINTNQDELMLNIHALAAIEGDEEQLRKDTIRNLTYINELILKNTYPLKIAVELNRSKGEVDPCTTYEGVMDICKQVNSPCLGIGWDFGHTYANYQNNLILRVPKENFIEKIIHTHIYDISPEGKTHWPLTMSVVPLEEYLELLKRVNYNGIYMLELQPGRFSEYGNLKELIFSSIDVLKTAIKKINN
ncbi:hypothetical protein ES705_44151 [subsurface metagenome]